MAVCVDLIPYMPGHFSGTRLENQSLGDSGRNVSRAGQCSQKDCVFGTVSRWILHDFQCRDETAGVILVLNESPDEFFKRKTDLERVRLFRKD